MQLAITDVVDVVFCTHLFDVDVVCEVSCWSPEFKIDIHQEVNIENNGT